jgi:hypothetical protein
MRVGPARCGALIAPNLLGQLILSGRFCRPYKFIAWRICSLIKADANRHKGIGGDKGLSSDASGRVVEKYLAVLDDAAFGGVTSVTPKFVSPADPAARFLGVFPSPRTNEPSERTPQGPYCRGRRVAGVRNPEFRYAP